MTSRILPLLLLFSAACFIDGTEPSGDGDGDGDGDMGMCVESYEPCGTDADAGCCNPDDLCVYDPMLDLQTCRPACVDHDECGGCCMYVQLASGVAAVCSQSFLQCEEVDLCIETCSDAQDGICQDGGPGSSADTCEYGTDCLDCGARAF